MGEISALHAAFWTERSPSLRAGAARRPPAAPSENRLLGALPPAEYEALQHDLERVHLPLGTSIWQARTALRYAYFPTDGVVSLFYLDGTGATSALALVGREGMLGVPLILGSETTETQALVVASACSAYRLPARTLRARFADGGAFQSILLRYVLALFDQASQTAVCNLHHTVEQQLCRWLLHAVDRLRTNRLLMTQELIASMLGVRRQGIAEAAGKLAKRGVIAYSRGHITVLDHGALLGQACECYAVINEGSDRLVQKPPSPCRAF